MSTTQPTAGAPAQGATPAARPAAKPAGPRRIHAPRVLPEVMPFWEAAKEGRLLIKRCEDCGETHYYPRDICPHCMSSNTEWLDTKGVGTVYSFSTMGKDEGRYTLAYVTLDEGVTMLTNLVDCDPAALSIGQRVKLVFKPSEGDYPVAMFTPV
ncbi:Zn-ribbon domain-containing OB-fold protein [Paraburkholderia sp. MMS20-SJTN17]|uniref:Zn-ribbon domain-containing OB-fold protein n=1 Tax=Paraburkholderia translucens TaxID=2886945 RepID=A0ABS8KC45_9BURK|nr:Zn-ribbon domain-containing OB-fold protein [Paraburkholderia sp. MMS20-SJTN17]MCC8402333.1 Zn-ribbon domain-containing OB-fold protein [Paraburkholderia sp. MMS20-SJTN17]